MLHPKRKKRRARRSRRIKRYSAASVDMLDKMNLSLPLPISRLASAAFCLICSSDRLALKAKGE